MKLTRIKLARLKSGMFQWKLAQKIGVPESYLSMIETGRIKPSEEILKKIATALELPVEYLRENEECPHR